MVDVTCLKLNYNSIRCYIRKQQNDTNIKKINNTILNKGTFKYIQQNAIF